VKTLTLTIVFFMGIVRLFAADEAIMSNYSAHGYRQYYTLTAINAVAERFTFTKPILLKSLRILTSGDSAATARVRIIGFEGGLPIPYQEQSLLPSLRIKKTKQGIELITVELEHVFPYAERQLFIITDSTEGNMKILMDNTPHTPICTYGQTQYYHQVIREEEQWKTGPFSFCIDIIYTEQEQTKEYGTYHRDTNYIRIEKTVKNTLKSYNKSLALEDINNDGYTDILYNGLLWINKQNRVELYSSDQKQCRAHVFADIDRDGWKDIVYIGKYGEKDTIYNASYMLNQRGKYGKEHNFRISSLTVPVTVSVADFNNDGYSDLFIGQTGYTDKTEQIILFYNPAKREFEEYNNILPKVNTGGASIYDADKDGKPDIMIADISTGRLRTFLNRGNKTFHERMETVIGTKEEEKKYRGLSIGTEGERNMILSPTAGLRTEKEEKKEERTEKKEQLLTMGSGGIFCDMDGDGYTDYVTTSSCYCRYAELYRYDGTRYENMSLVMLSDTVSATGEVLYADMDNDNDPDLIFTGTLMPTVYHYTSEKKRHMVVQAERRMNAPVAGSMITVYKEEKKQQYQIVSGHGLLVQGLGDIIIGNKEIDSIAVQWAGEEDKEEIYKDIKEGGKTVLKEGKGIQRTIDRSGYKNLHCYPNPFSEEITIGYRLTETAQVHVGIYDMRGKLLYGINESGVQKAGEYSYSWSPSSSGQVMVSGQYQIGLRINGQLVKFHEITYIH